MTSLKAALLVAAAGVAFVALPSGAADYPAKPIRIIVGFAAGGAPDTLARVVGDKLAQDSQTRRNHLLYLDLSQTVLEGRVDAPIATKLCPFDPAPSS
jgi:hypothetical protein